ncbi:protein required for assembly of ubiquinol cytochrome-c reductase complex [Scheffersomyces coipomensis]|uniref:protein required for assembly of ubiquinol cytochrome-c reductase complex n=1 Tax=Scheffersomyces coipomensis TaxID=1788519 RepID=UPI00315D0A6B
MLSRSSRRLVVSSPSIIIRRRISTTKVAQFESKNSILDKYKKPEEVESPSQLAADSTLPNIKQDLKTNPRQASSKGPFLSDNSIENDPTYKMSGWKQSIGQQVIKLFQIDMDKSRSGPVAGSVYFGECKRQGLYYPDEPLSDTAKFYYETLKLPQSFNQQFQISILHYWILSVRMRALPFKYGKDYQQKLVDRLFRDLELRMAQELKINSNRIIEGYLKDYHTQLLGSVLTYDEGLVTDDITLASALWRNVFNGNPNVDIRHIEALLVYVRSQLYVLSKMTDREFGFGKFKFVPPNQTVKPITKAQEQELIEKAKQEFATSDLPSQKSVLSLDE